jgi:hypothetical protein
MNHLKFTKICLAGLAILMLPLLSSQALPLNNGVNVLNLTLKGGGKVHLEMELKRYHQGLLGKPLARDSWWGAWDSDVPLPNNIIWKMTLLVDGKSAALPESAYAYLSNCSTLTIQEDQSTIVVHLDGGDAGESYEVVWRFTYSTVLQYYVLRSRSIHHGEFPEVHENTDYTYNENKDI